jgi:hypothetical protein
MPSVFFLKFEGEQKSRLQIFSAKLIKLLFHSCCLLSERLFFSCNLMDDGSPRNEIDGDCEAVSGF